MPVLQPAELWQRSGRYGIDELFKLKDRKGADLVLAMTHEENVTMHVAQVVRSYRDLPLILYHIQAKERDEPRPRAGVLRTREFIMKDSYTFDRDAEGSSTCYDLHIQAYDRIFDRCGLEWYRVESDVGMMGGLGAHEYMAPCPAGENEVALSASGYAANVEVASATPQPVEGLAAGSTGGGRARRARRRSRRCRGQLGVPPGALIKAFPVIAEERGAGPRADARRPPAERGQAPQRARARTSARRRRTRSRPSSDRSRLHRPGGRARAGRRGRGAPGLEGLVAGANEADKHVTRRPARPRLRSRMGRRPLRRGGRHRRRRARRSGSSRRSRSATSSSSARATRSRSARPTWTRTARSS